MPVVIIKLQHARRILMTIRSDDLGHMSENEVYSLFKKLDSYLARLGRNWFNSKDRNIQREAKEVEIDLCYVMRELESRKKRAQHHAEYIKNKSRQ